MKSVLRTVTVLGSVFAILFILAACCSESLINASAFFPQKGMQEDPQTLGAPVEEVFVQTQDGVKVSAFYLPRPGAVRTFLFFHGNAGNASHRLRDATELWKMDANVLLMDYRGYGLSEGEPSEKGVYLDGEAGLRHLTEDGQIPLDRIVVFGRSLGSAVAVHIAQNRKLAGVILVSPLSSGRDVAKQRGLGWMGSSIGNPFDSRTKIKRLQAPLLIFHGDRDEVLDFEMGRALYEQAIVEKEFMRLEGAGHNDLIARNPATFFGKVREFLDRVVPLEKAPASVLPPHNNER